MKNTILPTDFNFKKRQTKHTLFRNTAKCSKIIKKTKAIIFLVIWRFHCRAQNQTVGDSAQVMTK